MKMTRWFIERGTIQGDWIQSAHNPPEGWESAKAAENWIKLVLNNPPSIRVASREVEAIVKIKSTIVELEIFGTRYRRKEEGQSIEWSQHYSESRWSDDKGWVQRYSTHDGKIWCEQDENCYIKRCEEPEIEGIWKEQSNE